MMPSSNYNSHCIDTSRPGSAHVLPTQADEEDILTMFANRPAASGSLLGKRCP